jgi:hypothetical protein
MEQSVALCTRHVEPFFSFSFCSSSSSGDIIATRFLLRHCRAPPLCVHLQSTQVIVPSQEHLPRQQNGIPNTSQTHDPCCALGMASRHHDARLELVDAVAREHGTLARVEEGVIF